MNNQHLNWWPKDFYLHQFTRDAFLKLEKNNVINTSYVEYLKLLPSMQRTIVKNITDKDGSSIYEFLDEIKGYEVTFFSNPELFTKMYFLKYEEKLRELSSIRKDLNVKKDSVLTTKEVLTILKQL
jgi:hypothetical protein